MTSTDSTNFKFELSGVSMNGLLIKDSEKWNISFVDTGTTFSYFPEKMWE